MDELNVRTLLATGEKMVERRIGVLVAESGLLPDLHEADSLE